MDSMSCIRNRKLSVACKATSSRVEPSSLALRRGYASALAHSVDRSRIIGGLCLKGNSKNNSAALGVGKHQQRRSSIVRSGVDDLDDYDEETGELKTVEDLDWKAKFFGIYLQIGVWVSVLSFAGYTGYKKILEEANGAQEVGLLIAPTSAALFLIITFVVYFVSTQKKDE